MGIQWKYNGNIMGIWFAIITMTMEVPHNEWFFMGNPIRIDENWGWPYDLGKPQSLAQRDDDKHSDLGNKHR